jgi:membrane protein YqaA with SNARE-associated domain
LAPIWRRFLCLERVRSLFFAVLGYFLTPLGLVLMGVLDASVVFFLPLGIDFVLVLMTARKPDLFWLFAVLAAIGSVTGAAVTFWMGRQVGEHGLTRFVPEKRLNRVRAKVNNGAAIPVAALAVIPPPFPFTPFVLTSGALGVDAWTFLSTLAGVRALRFGVEALLAHFYGRQILRWMQTPTFKAAVGVFIALAAVGTVASAVALWSGSRRGDTRGPRSDNAGGRRRRRAPRAATNPR